MDHHHSTLTHDHGGVVTSISEGALHDGQLLLGDAVSAAAALVGVQDQNTGVVSIPMHAAAAMMQIQGLFSFVLLYFFYVYSDFHFNKFTQFTGNVKKHLIIFSFSFYVTNRNQSYSRLHRQRWWQCSIHHHFITLKLPNTSSVA